MNRQTATSLAVIALLFSGCATVQQGSDPIVVNAERDTQLAADTFDLLVKTEYDQRANIKAINPTLGASIKTGTDVIRRNAKEWLQSARVMTQAYKYNRTATNAANLQTAMATLAAGLSQAQGYIDQLQTVTKP